MNINLTRVAMTTLVGLSLHTVAHAATDIVSASFGIQNLGYVLTDLNTNDGIKASVTFTSNAEPQGTLSVQETARFTTIDGSQASFATTPYFTSQAVNLGLTDGSAQARVDSTKGGSLSASGGLSTSQINNAIAQAQLDSKQTSDISTSSRVANNYQEFTLAAHTAITFTGLAQGSINVNRTAMNTLIDQSGFAADHSLTVAGSVNVWATLGSQAATDEISNQLWLTYGADTFSDSRLFSLTLRNDSGTSQQGTINVGAWQESSYWLYGKAVAVPEPSTWALYLLGLVGLAASCQQRRRQG